MAHLLDLTAQGDVATVTDESKLAGITLMDPQQLYELWERQPWASHTIDFTQDKADWAALSESERSDISWNLSSFFVGEERVATQFSGLVRAYESQAEEAFLTTQQVDEVRHAQHFDRFYAQVVGHDGTFERRLDEARNDLNPAFVELFDEHLVEAQELLLADPTDLRAKVDFVVLYHMLIEGTLALTGQYFITETFERRGILPGFLEGFRKISQDEHRHVAYGTWYLQSKVREDRAWAEHIRKRLVELLPVTAAVLVPPGMAPEDDYEVLGHSKDETNTFAFTALSRRLKVIGVDLMAGVV
jgi:ribonucleoside-diphosphate reductase beta chain